MASNAPHTRTISFIADVMWACAWYRCHVPGVELLRRGHDVTLHEDLSSLVGKTPDILVAQAMVHPGLYREMQRMKAAGTKCVFDIDDDLFALHPDNPGHRFWQRDDAQEMLAKFLRTVDVVTTTTPELAERVARFNRNVVVLPNMLPSEQWQDLRRDDREGGAIVVGWAGSGSHIPDIRSFEDVLLQVLDRHENVEVHLAGAKPEWLRGSHPRLRFLDGVKIEQYPQLIAQFDIGIAPLLDNRFNRGKSDLKLVEYGMCGLPVVASRIPSYERFIRHGENGYLATNAKDWLKALSALVEDPALRERLGSNLRRAAQNRTIERHIGRWEKAYGIEG